jgi:hypothetical protein
MSSGPLRESRNQVAAGAFLALWSLAGWSSFLTTPALRADDYGVDPGPDLLPYIVLVTLSLGAVLLIGAGLRRMFAEPGNDRYWRQLFDGSMAPALFIVSLIVYVVAIDAIGYLISSALLAFAWMTIVGLRNRDKPTSAVAVRAALATAIGIGAIYVVFVYLIGVPVR